MSDGPNGVGAASRAGPAGSARLPAVGTKVQEVPGAKPAPAGGGSAPMVDAPAQAAGSGLDVVPDIPPMRILRVLDDMLCPISGQPLVDAMVTENGYAYSRASIERWFRVAGGPKCPIDMKLLPSAALRPVVPLQNIVDQWCAGVASDAEVHAAAVAGDQKGLAALCVAPWQLTTKLVRVAARPAKAMILRARPDLATERYIWEAISVTPPWYLDIERWTRRKLSDAEFYSPNARCTFLDHALLRDRLALVAELAPVLSGVNPPRRLHSEVWHAFRMCKTKAAAEILLAQGVDLFATHDGGCYSDMGLQNPEVAQLILDHMEKQIHSGRKSRDELDSMVRLALHNAVDDVNPDMIRFWRQGTYKLRNGTQRAEAHPTTAEDTCACDSGRLPIHQLWSFQTWYNDDFILAFHACIEALAQDDDTFNVDAPDGDGLSVLDYFVDGIGFGDLKRTDPDSDEKRRYRGCEAVEASLLFRIPSAGMAYAQPASNPSVPEEDDNVPDIRARREILLAAYLVHRGAFFRTPLEDAENVAIIANEARKLAYLLELLPEEQAKFTSVRLPPAAEMRPFRRLRAPAAVAGPPCAPSALAVAARAHQAVATNSAAAAAPVLAVVPAAPAVSAASAQSPPAAHAAVFPAAPAEAASPPGGAARPKRARLEVEEPAEKREDGLATAPSAGPAQKRARLETEAPPPAATLVQADAAVVNKAAAAALASRRDEKKAALVAHLPPASAATGQAPVAASSAAAAAPAPTRYSDRARAHRYLTGSSNHLIATLASAQRIADYVNEHLGLSFPIDRRAVGNLLTGRPGLVIRKGVGYALAQ